MRVGLVLAGGASRRLGQPKALLQLEGESFLTRLCRLMAPHCQDFWIVTGAHDREMRANEAHLSEKMIFNKQHESGQLSSLQCGLTRIPMDASLLFSPVDFAAVHARTLEALMGAQAASEAAVIKPRFEGQSGHPVLVRPAAAQALRQGSPEENAKQILRRFASYYVDVSDPFCASDVDTMEDYERLLRSWSAAQ